MSDNLPTNVQLDSNQNGSVSFATEVIATIAGLAANEVEGVNSMYGGSQGFAGILTRSSQSTKNLTKGVRVDLSEGRLSVYVSIIIDFGSPAPEVARNIQENIKKAIETMSGLTVSNVDVHVQGVSFEKEQKAAAEIEQQQRILLQQKQQQSAIGGEKAPDEAEAAEELVPEQPEDDGEYELELEDVDMDEDEEQSQPES